MTMWSQNEENEIHGNKAVPNIDAKCGRLLH